MTDGNFFSRTRVRRIGIVWIVLTIVFYLFDVARFIDFSVPKIVLHKAGQDWPLGADFINTWSGAALFWAGRGVEIFDWPRYHAFQVAMTGDPSLDHYNYSYPPILLLMTLPFGLLPYVPALILWIATGGAALFAALRALRPKAGALFLTLAAPAVFINAVAGQNGMFSAALLGGGLAVLPKNPLVAGIFFGLLSFKPQLGLLIPVALLAGREGRAFFAAAATTLVLFGLSLVVFGPDMWLAYAAHVDVMRRFILEDGTGVWHRMVSVFVMARHAGLGVNSAYAVQAVAALVSIAMVIKLWLQPNPQELRAAALIVGLFFAAPYVQDYDMVVIVFAALGLAQWVEKGGESLSDVRWIMGFMLLAPICAAPVGKSTGWLGIAPLMLLPALGLLVRQAFFKQTRVMAETGKPSVGRSKEPH